MQFHQNDVINAINLNFVFFSAATEEEGDSDVSNASATPQSGAAVVGHKFFGPDFSLDAFKGTNPSHLKLGQVT